MEMECKVVFKRLEDMEKFREALLEKRGCPPLSEELQENHFFDSPNRLLANAASALRLRLISSRDVGEITLKEDAHTMHGTTLRWSSAATVPLRFARNILEIPNSLLLDVAEDGSNVELVKTLRQKYHMDALQYIGGFRTVRTLYPHPGSEVQPTGLTLKMDIVEYPFAKRYEVEVAGVIVPIGDILDELCTMMDKAGVLYEKSEKSKFEIFQAGMHDSMVHGDLRSSSICMDG